MVGRGFGGCLEGERFAPESRFNQRSALGKGKRFGLLGPDKGSASSLAVVW